VGGFSARNIRKPGISWKKRIQTKKMERVTRIVMHVKTPAALFDGKLVPVNDGAVLCGVKKNANRVQYTIFTPDNGACKDLSGTVL
jgi:hypothetical protein